MPSSTQSGGGTTVVRLRDLILVAIAAVIGTTIEWYIFFSAAISAAMVWVKIFLPPAVTPALALAYSLVVSLLVGFVARPIGGFIFSHYGDRMGRKWALVWNLVLIGIGSLGIGLTPTYAQIGLGGLILLGIFMFIVGLGVGGEWGGASSWVLENAYMMGSRWRAFWASWVQQGVPIGLLLASAVLGILAAVYGPSFLTFGWRVAFYIGAAIIVVGIAIRYGVIESLLFERYKLSGPLAKRPEFEVWRYHWKEILLGMFLTAADLAPGYFFIALTPVVLTVMGEFSTTAALLSQTIASLTAVFFIIAFAMLGDRIGRRWVSAILFAIGIPFVFIYKYMVVPGNYALAVLAQILLWGLITMGAYSVYSALIPEQFPVKYRYSGASMAYQIGAVIGGGLGPILISYFVGTAYATGWWTLATILAIYCLLGVISPLLMKETKAAKLES